MKKTIYELPLSLRDSLEITRDMWDWLSENPGKFKGDYYAYLKQLGTILPSMNADCACCEYTKGVSSTKRVVCSYCPLASLWVKDGQICETLHSSPYKRWYNDRYNSTAAKQIADAARKELRKLDEQELLNKTALNLYKEEKKQEPLLKWQAEREAEKQGKVIQFRDKIFYTEWTDIVSPSWLDGSEYRIKPTPKYRAWKPEEVPVGSWIRPEGDNKPSLILATNSDSIITCGVIDGLFTITHDKLVRGERYQYEHSLDQGKTWLPCGVLVEDQNK